MTVSPRRITAVMFTIRILKKAANGEEYACLNSILEMTRKFEELNPLDILLFN